MEAVFSEDALTWLRKEGFKDDEMEEARKQISTAWKHFEEGKEVSLKLPKGTSAKVAAIVYAALSVTDVRGKPVSFHSRGVISLSEGVRETFREEMEIGSYEDLISKAAKIKLSRGLSDPKKRSSVKKERYKSL
jgi:hypothetical protein